LGDEAAGWAADEVEGLMCRRRLGPMERVWLAAIARRLREAADPRQAAPTADDGMSPDPGSDGALDTGELMLWRDDLAELPTAQRRAVLAPVLESGDPGFLPVLEVALSLGDAGLDVAVAEGLGQFATPRALPLLRELLQRPDPATRRKARESLVVLAQRGVAGPDLFVARLDGGDAATRAFATEPDRTGSVVVAVVTREDGGTYRYAVAVVDPLELGIEEVWGEAGLSEGAVREQLLWLAEDHGLDLQPMDLNAARALVAAGEEFAREQGHELPAAYVVWRRRFGRPSGQAALPVVFGPRCAECGTRLRHDDVARGGLVAGDVALCGTCAEGPRACAACGRRLHAMFDDLVVRRDPGGAALLFLCRACDERGQGR
ncbi:MAG: HEAT repeat domain-containing protein, partial [bacterium]